MNSRYYLLSPGGLSFYSHFRNQLREPRVSGLPILYVIDILGTILCCGFLWMLCDEQHLWSFSSRGQRSPWLQLTSNHPQTHSQCPRLSPDTAKCLWENWDYVLLKKTRGLSLTPLPQPSEHACCIRTVLPNWDGEGLSIISYNHLGIFHFMVGALETK